MPYLQILSLILVCAKLAGYDIAWVWCFAPVGFLIALQVIEKACKK